MATTKFGEPVLLWNQQSMYVIFQYIYEINMFYIID